MPLPVKIILNWEALSLYKLIMCGWLLAEEAGLWADSRLQIGIFQTALSSAYP